MKSKKNIIESYTYSRKTSRRKSRRDTKTKESNEQCTIRITSKSKR